MTLLVGVVSMLLAVATAAGIGTVGLAATTDARAQVAADAAALAAVAESAPHGGGQPHVQAERFAEANGAVLIECVCPPGELAAQVKVAIGDLAASARAVLDPSLIRSGVAGTTVGLDPVLASAVERLIAASGGLVHVVSGYRGPDEQRRLWAEALSVYGSAEEADDWVARPGTSLHEKGLAVDLGGDLLHAARLVDSLGLPLVRPLENELWHYELASSRAEPDVHDAP